MDEQSERPFTDAEIQILERRLRQFGEWISDAAWYVGGCGLMDAIIALSIVAAIFYGDNSGPWSWLIVVSIAIIATFFLVIYYRQLIYLLNERRMLREAKEDGLAQIERITSNAAAHLRDKPGTSWYLMDVGEGLLYVLSEGDVHDCGEPIWPEPYRPGVIMASLEITRTKRRHLFLNARAIGTTTAPLETRFWRDVIPDAKTRRELDRRLQRESRVTGRLVTLSDDLVALLQTPSSPT